MPTRIVEKRVAVRAGRASVLIDGPAGMVVELSPTAASQLGMELIVAADRARRRSVRAARPSLNQPA